LSPVPINWEDERQQAAGEELPNYATDLVARAETKFVHPDAENDEKAKKLSHLPPPEISTSPTRRIHLEQPRFCLLSWLRSPLQVEDWL
jgi:hypothetical protein